MGTSLSGLTPATTFDGLLKTSDNEPLDGTLKTIGTGDGTDSILQLSDSALQVNGQATMVGLTNNTSASAIFAQNSDGYNLFQVRNDGTTIINNNAYSFSQPRFTSTKEVVIHQGLSVGQTASPTSRLHIKGSGTTSATTSLLVQNSEGSNLLQANDDGVVLIGPENIYKNHLLELKGSGSNSEMLLRLQSNFNGGGGYTGIAFTNSTNGGGISSSIRGYRESDHYAIALNFGSNEGVDVLRAKNTGEVGIGETTPTARLHVKGSGNDNTTTSLLVQNSDGIPSLTISDDRHILVGDSSAQGNAANLTFIRASGGLRGANFRQVNQELTLTNPYGGFVVNGIQTTLKGSGTTSATTSLLVQNSAGTELFKVRDDNKIYLGGSTTHYIENGYNFFGSYYWANTQIMRGSLVNDLGSVKISDDLNVGGNTNNDTGVRLQVKGSGNDSTTTALLVQNSDGDDILKVTDDKRVLIDEYIYPADGTTNSRFQLSNSTGTYMRYSTGYIKLNPNLEYASATYGIVFGVSSTTGDFSLNGATGAKMAIKGNGTTSATTALLVQNSAGTDLLKVTDDGSVFSNGGGAKISSNTGFGEGVLASVTTANNTSAFGVGALQSVTTGVSNTGIGWRAGYSTTGSNNAFVGLMAGYTNSSGANNTGVGTRVLYDNATGSDNTAVGYLADSDGFSGNVILGREATATANNQFVVGSSGTNAGTITTEAVTSDATWEVVINGTTYKVLLKAV